LRGRSGDVIEVVDADRRLFVAELGEGREAVVREEIPVPVDGGTEVELFQAVPKGRHMDLVVEKATELGVTGISPLVTERGVVRPKERGKLHRWRRVAEAAARQSLRLRVPQVREPVSFPEAVRGAGEGGVLLHNNRRLPPLEEGVSGSSVHLFVGPEGGWSEGEIRAAEEAGVALAQLGPYRLRSETAGIVAVARARAALERPVHSIRRGA
jgi:16S rRNA (uracil1498-N3)-methyltransferase